MAAHVLSERPSIRRLVCGGFAAAVAIFVGPSVVVAAERAAAPDGASSAATLNATAPDYHAPEDPRELLKVDDAMRSFFRPRVDPQARPHDQLQQIVDAILLPEGLGFTYDAAGTFEARETFRRRRGNCASYAFLVVAMAREFGLNASFQNVARARRWARVDGLVMVVLHLDVRVTTDDQVLVVDLNPELTPLRENELEVISDARASAQFYSNIGIHYIAEQRFDEARRYLTLAIDTDPRSAGAWANRGTLLTRLGALQKAKADFERALRADRRSEIALDGYVTVLRLLGSPGDLRLATKYERKAQKIRQRNPYYLEYLALRAREAGDLPAAEKHLRHAIARKSDEAEFYVEWADVLTRLGRPEEAGRAEKKLRKLQQKLAPAPWRAPHESGARGS